MKKLKILAVVCSLLMTTNVYAALQSRPGVDAKRDATVENMFNYIRDMESEGGALGLSANFATNATTKEYEETTSSNNIDTHLCKNTEWGAIAMLSASNYGAGNGNVKNNYNSTTKTYGVTASTTGNMTGVFGMFSGAAGGEFVAGGVVSQLTVWPCDGLKTVSLRYIDNYKTGTSSSDFSNYIPGDATYETRTFSGNGGFFVTSGTSSLFYRGNSYGIFNFGTSYGGESYGSRACVWVGNGI
ncbi:MAG: hypothetical protein IKL68_05720 [Clostridia bacterium]|nr:hypothetical protein [Clostridia bacterium]